MTKNEALNTLIAHGCCVSVIEEAVNIMLEEMKNEEDENGRH